ncbi:MAG: hypothetical protein QUV05_07300 [Phycisphaerae bacterium]|nr:hypothetical protein [Phycisphaerae bacterium]
MTHQRMQLIVMGASTLLTAGTAPAHVPYLETTDFTWEKPFRVRGSIAQSIAVYGWLEGANGVTEDIDVCQFTLRRPTKVFVETLVPVCTDYAEFRPSFAIVGPGLDVPNEALPFELPEGYGAIVVPNYSDPQRPTFYEPFGNKSYYDGPEFEQVLSTPGTYYVVVWDPAGIVGDYVAVLGDKEVWWPWDIIRALIQTPKIRRGLELHTDCR